MERDLAEDAARISGTVRITASVGFGLFAIEPLLPAFAAAYPKVVVDLSLSDEIAMRRGFMASGLLRTRSM